MEISNWLLENHHRSTMSRRRWVPASYTSNAPDAQQVVELLFRESFLPLVQDRGDNIMRQKTDSHLSPNHRLSYLTAASLE